MVALKDFKGLVGDLMAIDAIVKSRELTEPT
jgi:hypothetical protein